jgi:hypothetical protein
MKNKILILSTLTIILALTLLSIYTVQTNNNYTATNNTNITLTSTKPVNTHTIEITATCDIISTQDNTITIEYRDNTYKCYVKDSANYTNLSEAIITFSTNNIYNLSTYQIINIKPTNNI